MGNTLAAIQQWSPQVVESSSNFSLGTNLFKVVLECPIQSDNTSQQLMRVEEKDSVFLQQLVERFEQEKQNLRLQWYPKNAMREKDLLIVYVFKNSSEFCTFRVGPRSLQLIESNYVTVEEDGVIGKMIKDFGLYEKLYRYETEKNIVWPVHTLLVSRLRSARNTETLPLVVEKQTLETKQTKPKQTLIWSLVLRSVPGKEEEAKLIREQMARLMTELETSDQPGGGSVSDEDTDENENAMQLEELQQRLNVVLDFDDPLRQTGAIEVSENNKSCIDFIEKQIRLQLAPDDEVTGEEMKQFVLRKIAQLKKSNQFYLQNTSSECDGLTILDPKTPFDFDATELQTLEIFQQNTHLRAKAHNYYAPHDSAKIVEFGEELMMLFKDYCLNNAIPQSRISKLKTEKNSFKSRKINKILKQNLKPIILKISENIFETDALTLEIKIIKSIGRRNINLGPLTNLTDGGEGISGLIRTTEHQEKLRQSQIGRKVSNETKHKIRLSLLGKKGRNTGNKHTEETKKKISQTKKGTISWNATPIQQLSKDNIVISEWASAHNAAKTLNLSQGNIFMVLNGFRKTCGGYKWKYL